MKLASSELLMYDSLPCQKIRVFRSLNYFIEKSAAKAACIPYFPTIPIPTSAAWIIPTSLPPSPIPKTDSLLFLCFFTPAVNSFFWLGEHLQQIMVGIFIAVMKKSFDSSSLYKTYVSVLPSMMRIWLRFSLTFYQW